MCVVWCVRERERTGTCAWRARQFGELEPQAAAPPFKKNLGAKFIPLVCRARPLAANWCGADKQQREKGGETKEARGGAARRDVTSAHTRTRSSCVCALQPPKRTRALWRDRCLFYGGGGGGGEVGGVASVCSVCLCTKSCGYSMSEGAEKKSTSLVIVINHPAQVQSIGSRLYPNKVSQRTRPSAATLPTSAWTL